MSNYTIEVTENVVNLDVLKDHDIVIEIKSSDNFITFDTPSGYPIAYTSGILAVNRMASGYLIENLTSGNTIVRTFGDQNIAGYKTFSNDVVTSGNLAIRSQPAFISPSYFPVFISDPSTFSRNIYTRTPSQIKSDLGINNVQNIALSGINFSAGSGLVGGGNLSSSRTFDIGQGDGLTVSADSVGVNSTVIRTSGDQTIAGFTTFIGSGIRITTGAIGPYRKDIVFKANVGTLFSNTVTIIPTNNLYTDRTYYLPEAGADADFVLTAGSQVITGPKTFTNSLIFNSGSFQSLRVGVTDVSLSGHTHTSSNITDFNTSVDSRITNANLQPSGNYSIVGHTHTISNVTGLQTALDNKQASGNYSLVGHTHTSSNITDFNTSVSGLVNGIYAPLNSPSFTGTPLTPTASAGTNNTQIASTAFVRTEISNLVASAPTALDTLNELATALGNDANFSTTVTNNLAGKANLSGATFTGSISGPSGNFTSLKVNNVDVSTNGHTHTSSNITDFNSSVSGLLPVKNISNGNYISLSSTTGNYTISVTGLQPSGNYSVIGHTHSISDISNLQTTLDNKQPSGNYALSSHNHISSQITDFNSSVSGLLPVKNIIGGSGIQVGSNSGEYIITAYGVAAASASSLITEAYNNTASTIPKGSVVYINGGQGNLPTISLSIANGESGSSKTYGIAAENIGSNNNGDVVVIGSLIDFNTEQFGVNEGSTLYLSPTVSGGITPIKPLSPNHMVSVGTVVRRHPNQGVIEVRIQNGFELYELHDVAVSGVSNGQFLQYNSASGLWLPSVSGNFSTLSVNNNPVYHSGILPNPVTGVGTSGYLTKWISSSGVSSGVIFDNGTNIGIGTTSPSSKLDVNGNVNIDGNLTFDSFTESVVAIGNSSTSQTISLTSGTVQTCTLTGNCTFTMPTATAGKSFTMFLNTGTGNFTATFSGVRWADSATPTATILANKVDIYSFISDGTYWYGSFSQNYG